MTPAAAGGLRAEMSGPHSTDISLAEVGLRDWLSGKVEEKD